jgi:hypothetical protein
MLFVRFLEDVPVEDLYRTWAAERTIMLSMTSKKVIEAIDGKNLPMVVRVKRSDIFRPEENIQFIFDRLDYMSSRYHISELKLNNNNIKDIAEREGVRSKKWVAFVGAGHVNERYGVPGICEIIADVQDIVIKDAVEGGKSSLEVSETKKIYEIDVGKGEVDRFRTSILLTLDLNEKNVSYEAITSKLHRKAEEKNSQDSTSTIVPNPNDILCPSAAFGLKPKKSDHSKD